MPGDGFSFKAKGVDKVKELKLGLDILDNALLWAYEPDIDVVLGHPTRLS